MTPEERFAEAVARYDRDPRVSAGTGFGGAPGRRVDGRIFAMLARHELVVKLPGERVSRLVAEGTAAHFDAGKGRPMREWASVPASSQAGWGGLVAEAFAFVAGAGS